MRRAGAQPWPLPQGRGAEPPPPQHSEHPAASLGLGEGGGGCGEGSGRSGTSAVGSCFILLSAVPGNKQLEGLLRLACWEAATAPSAPTPLRLPGCSAPRGAPMAPTGLRPPSPACPKSNHPRTAGMFMPHLSVTEQPQPCRLGRLRLDPLPTLFRCVQRRRARELRCRAGRVISSLPALSRLRAAVPVHRGRAAPSQQAPRISTRLIYRNPMAGAASASCQTSLTAGLGARQTARAATRKSLFKHFWPCRALPLTPRGGGGGGAGHKPQAGTTLAATRKKT